MKCRKTGNRLWTCRRAPAILILACFESFSAKPKLRPKPGCPGDSRRRSAYFTAYANRCGRVPGGHVIDGGDRLVSFKGRKPTSNRESVVIYVGCEFYRVKWRNWKIDEQAGGAGLRRASQAALLPVWFDLHTDTREENPLDPQWVENGWVRWSASQMMAGPQEEVRAGGEGGDMFLHATGEAHYRPMSLCGAE